jgi:hypothetical protein
MSISETSLPVGACARVLRRVHAAGDSSTVVSSLLGIPDCDGTTCGKPSSALLAGRLAPPAAGNYGFQLTFDRELPFPSEEAYARLWVHDHLLYPINIGNSTSGSKRAGGAHPRTNAPS